MAPPLRVGQRHASQVGPGFSEAAPPTDVFKPAPSGFEIREFYALCDRAHRWPLSFMPKPASALARVLFRGIGAVHFEPSVPVSNQLEDTALTESSDTVE